LVAATGTEDSVPEEALLEEVMVVRKMGGVPTQADVGRLL
jgi:hypothetical protein